MVEEQGELNYQKFVDIESNITKIFKVLNDTLASNNMNRIQMVTTVPFTNSSAKTEKEKNESSTKLAKLDKIELDTIKKDIIDMKNKFEKLQNMQKELIISQEKEKEEKEKELAKEKELSKDKSVTSTKSIKSIQKIAKNDSKSKLIEVAEEGDDKFLNKSQFMHSANNITNKNYIDNSVDLDFLKTFVEKQLTESNKQLRSIIDMKMDKMEYENNKNINDDSLTKFVFKFTNYYT